MGDAHAMTLRHVIPHRRWVLVPGQLLVCAFSAFTAVLLARFALERRGRA